ncbi:glycosyltransferase family 2 protein [Sphingosinithalassobacter portus]|uniref:glycosyltransferase family 2 protein n=1 Tax=Stakelama portus TaxID=2676234 RepID=UPI000D6E3402|nr:glycosyltransferase [Sphingosinithalassobacter portus]
MPKTTLVCGFYNRSHLVKRTIAGLAAQTLQDVEFLLFDDGSSDDTAEVIAAELARLGDARFRFRRHVENMGLTRGLIASIEATDSAFIAIHDAGDFSMPNRLSHQADFLAAHCDIVVTGSHYINYIEEIGIARTRKPCADGADLAVLLSDPTFTHGEVMFRRDAYLRAGGYRPEFRFSQDNDLWLRMIHEGQFHTVPEILYIRCIQQQGISYNPASLAQQSAFYVLGKKIATGEISADTALNTLRESGDVFAVLPKEAPDVQRVIQRAALRSLAFGSPRGADRIAEQHVLNGASSAAIRVAAAMFSNLLADKVLKAIWSGKTREAQKYISVMLAAEQI